MRRRTLIGWLGAVLPFLKVPAVAARDDDRRFDPAAFPWPVVTVDGAGVVETYDRLLAEGRGYPVVIGNNFAAALVTEAVVANDPPVSEILAQSDKPFAQALADYREAERRLYASEAEGIDEEEEVEVGSWPARSEGTEALSGYWTVEAAEAVNIALLPISDPTEAPAYLHFGGYNACPPALVHVAALRSFRDRYGARIVACTHDTLELRVSRRPTTRSEAMALARELYSYCPDSVLQGMETLSNLAAFLMVSDGWFLWWD